MIDKEEIVYLEELLGVKRNEIYRLRGILYSNPDSAYTVFEIPKKSGGSRTIRSPKKDLKIIQYRIKKGLLEERTKENSNKVSHGFSREKSIKTNAFVHTKKRCVINIDLDNFFESFTYGRVKGYLNKNSDFGLSDNISGVIAQFLCYRDINSGVGFLPQGAPTSPVMANLICQILDRRIIRIAKKYKLNYTRYADDMTFSTNRDSFKDEYDRFFSELKSLIDRSGFKINEKKTRSYFSNSRQEVTGLVVNKKVNVSREYYRQTRAMAHKLYTSRNKNVVDSNIEGRFNFIYFIKYGKDIPKNRNCGLLREMEKITFYKKFYKNERPIICTEGKTDPRYIKAALKSMYKDYPTLISKDGDKFSYKITFLRNNKSSQRSMGYSGGGSQLVNLLKYYRVEKTSTALIDKLCKYGTSSSGRSKPNNPVILLFDNETKKDTPLKKLNDRIIKENQPPLKSGYRRYMHNLYLLTIPHPLNEDTEMEDLFEEEWLNNLTIREKKYSRLDNVGKESFGKEVLSKYALDNYSNIDFSGFRALLDDIVKIIDEYHNDNV